MKKLFLISLMTIIFSGCAPHSVPTGHVGIKVYRSGTDKGVDIEEKGPGLYWLTINEELYDFPTFSQTQVWTHDAQEGSPNNDEMEFQAKGGMILHTDIGITYTVDPQKVSAVFQKYRMGVKEITNTYLRSMVRDALNAAASSRPIEIIYDSGKVELMNEVQKVVSDQVAPIGIKIEKIFLIGGIRPPDSFIESINRKMQAEQITAQKNEEVQQAKAEAEKQIEAARGESESKLLIAQAEARAIELKGKAIQQYPSILELSKIEKWNGQQPQVSGTSVPIISLK
jgi:regulator of protease activity HflC (stomatin/prohibitin superfamily)